MPPAPGAVGDGQVFTGAQTQHPLQVTTILGRQLGRIQVGDEGVGSRHATT